MPLEKKKMNTKVFMAKYGNKVRALYNIPTKAEIKAMAEGGVGKTDKEEEDSNLDDDIDGDDLINFAEPMEENDDLEYDPDYDGADDGDDQEGKGEGEEEADREMDEDQ